MAKLTLTDIASFSPSAITAINNNNAATETALENTLSRDGTSPNMMGADLDMNSNDILNCGGLDMNQNRIRDLPIALFDDEPVTLGQLEATVVAGGGAPVTASYVTLSSSTGLTGERVLTAGDGITITDGGANSTVTISSVTLGTDNLIYAADFGVVADAATDDTAEWNAVIAYANANPNTVCIVPQGDSLVTGVLDEITATGFYLYSYGQNNSRIVVRQNNTFTWSGSFGGAINVGFDCQGAAGTGSTTEFIHNIDGANNLTFDGCYLGTGVAGFARMGETSDASHINFKNMVGVVGSGATRTGPLFLAHGVVNLFFENLELRPSGGTIATGRVFLEFDVSGSQTLDLVRITDCDVPEWSKLILGDVSGTERQLGPLVIENGLAESMTTGGIYLSIGSTCWLNKMTLRNCWIRADAGDIIQISGAGAVYGVNIDSLVAYACHTNGIDIENTGATEDIVINGCQLFTFRGGVAGSAGIKLGGGASWKNVTITGNNIGADDTAYNTQFHGSADITPTYGIFIPSAIGNLNISGNNSRGTSAGLYCASTMVSPIITGNNFYPTTAFHATPTSGSPCIRDNLNCTVFTTHTEAEGGTNQTTYTLGDTLYASATNTLSKLGGNTTTSKRFLTQTGNGVASAAPAWSAIVAGDVPDLSATYQPLDSDLTAISALSSTGIAVQTAVGAWAQRTLVAPAAGITITSPSGVSGHPTFVLANDLAALEGLASTGIAVRTTTDTWAQRTITGTANQITVTNGDGVSGNPTLSLNADLASWALITRASGFDTFVATPSSANLAALVTGETGSGALVFATSPTLVTPALGTPSALVLTNATGLTSSGVAAATLVTAADTVVANDTDTTWPTTAAIIDYAQPLDSDLTSWAGVTRAAGFDTFAATPSSANLAALVTGETGTGALVFATSPTLVTPALGTPSALVLTNATGLTSSGVAAATLVTAADTIAANDNDTTWPTTAAIIDYSQPLDADLTAIAALGSTGIAVRTASNTWAQRSIAGTSNRITVTNGDGVSGAPTLDISTSYVGQATITTLGTIGTGTWQGTVIDPTYGGLGKSNTPSTGTVLYGDGTDFTTLAAGTSGYFLRSNGAAAPSWASVKPALTADSTIYTGTGNDTTGDGSVGNPYLTLQKAIDVAVSYDQASFKTTIQLVGTTPKTFTESVTLRSYSGAGPIIIKGDSATPANFVLTPTGTTLAVADGVVGKWVFNGVTLHLDTGEYGIVVQNGSTCAGTNLRMTTISGFPITWFYIANEGVFDFADETGAPGDLAFIGDCSYGVQLSSGFARMVNYTGTNDITFNSQTFGAWIKADVGSRFVANGNDYTGNGNFSGRPIEADGNSVLFISGSVFPSGSAASLLTNGAVTI